MKTVSNFVQIEKKPITQSVQAFLPKVALVPFCHQKNQDFNCIVKPGDMIKEGTVIAESSGDYEDFGLKIHSSIPGAVQEIVSCTLPDGCNGLAVKIRLAGEFSYLGKTSEKQEWSAKRSAELVSIFSTHGVVNTFEGVESLAEQIIDCKLVRDRFLIVRMFDEDPSRITDSFIAENLTSQVIEGTAIIARAMKADGVVFVYSNKFQGTIDTQIFNAVPSLKIGVDVSKYPLGFKRSLIHIINKYCKVAKTKYFSAVNHKNIYIDPQTAISAYDAVVLDKPVIERYVHVTGDCLECAGVLKMRVGATIGSLVEQMGGFIYPPAKVIVNGVLTGNAVSDMNIPITPMVKSVAFVPRKRLSDHHSNECVLCGNCRDICPEGLYPDLLYRRRDDGPLNLTELAKTTLLCSGCSLCNSACPSRLPLSQTIALLRENLHE